MTAAQLIAELLRMPQMLEVRVVTRSVWGGNMHDEEPAPLELDETDATVVDDVRNLGAYVLVRGR